MTTALLQNCFWQMLAAFCAIVGFSLILDVPKRLCLWCGLAGAADWGVWCLCTGGGTSVITASILSSLTAAWISQLAARKLRSPATVFLVAGILPTVPGAAIYRVAYYLIQGDSALAAASLVETIQIAGAMALGIFLMDAAAVLIWPPRTPDEPSPDCHCRRKE